MAITTCEVTMSNRIACMPRSVCLHSFCSEFLWPISSLVMATSACVEHCFIGKEGAQNCCLPGHHHFASVNLVMSFLAGHRMRWTECRVKVVCSLSLRSEQKKARALPTFAQEDLEPMAWPAAQASSKVLATHWQHCGAVGFASHDLCNMDATRGRVCVVNWQAGFCS